MRYRLAFWLTLLALVPAAAQVREPPPGVRIQLPTLTVRTVDAAGRPFSNAEVWLDTERLGRTNARGVLVIDRATRPSMAGQQLVARHLVREGIIALDAHQGGSLFGRNWNYRAWTWSHRPLEPVRTLPEVLEEDEIVLTMDRTVVGCHLVVSLEYDATATELASIRDEFQYASDVLYNATDGQFFLEQVDFYDNKTHWDNCDVRIFGNVSGRSNVPRAGAFLWGGYYATMNLKRNPPGELIVHEFGHYGLGLYDEYLDGNRDARCTARLHYETSSTYTRNGPRASCMMNIQWYTSKMCSEHPINPHVYGLPQVANCWSKIEEHYEANAGPLLNPQEQGMRNSVPSTVAPKPRLLAGTSMVSNTDLPGLRERFRIAVGEGGVHVWLRQQNGPEIYLGESSTPGGTLEVAGAHVGDNLVIGVLHRQTIRPVQPPRVAQVGPIAEAPLEEIQLAPIPFEVVPRVTLGGALTVRSPQPPVVTLRRVGEDKIVPVDVSAKGDLFTGTLGPLAIAQPYVLSVRVGEVEVLSRVEQTSPDGGKPGCSAANLSAGEIAVTLASKGQCLIQSAAEIPPEGVITGPYAVSADAPLSWVSFRPAELPADAVVLRHNGKGWDELPTYHQADLGVAQSAVSEGGVYALAVRQATAPAAAELAIEDVALLGEQVKVTARATVPVVLILHDATGNLVGTSPELPPGQPSWTFGPLAPGGRYAVYVMAADKSAESGPYSFELPGAPQPEWKPEPQLKPEWKPDPEPQPEGKPEPQPEWKPDSEEKLK